MNVTVLSNCVLDVRPKVAARRLHARVLELKFGHFGYLPVWVRGWHGLGPTETPRTVGGVNLVLGEASRREKTIETSLNSLRLIVFF